MSISHEFEAINKALSMVNSSKKQEIYELCRPPKELPNACILAFMVCKQGENYGRILILLFDKAKAAIDPNWIEFDDCVQRIISAIQKFWNGMCTEPKWEVPVR